MAEKDLRLDGPDGHGIYGVHSATGNNRLVVHVHGLTHNARHLLDVTSSEFFEENGYDHFRMSLYGREHDSRKLDQSTLTTHDKDIQAVLEHFQNAYKEVFVSAHSLGGLATLILNPKGVKAASFWDPSFDVTNFWASGPYLKHIPERREYHLDYGNIYVLGEAMVEEIKKYPDSKCLELAGKISTPTQLVIPEQSIFLASPHTSPEKYRAAFAGPFDLQQIKGANHTFSNRGNRQPLFKATLDWFNKHSLG